MTGDFNLFFDSKLEAQGGNPTLKKKSLAKLIECKETYDLCFIQCRLNCILISNTFQDFVTIMTLISTD